MTTFPGKSRLGPAAWTAVLLIVIVGFVLVCSALFAGTFRRFVSVALVSNRSGLVMEAGAKVKLRGVQVGRVAAVEDRHKDVRLILQIYPKQGQRIPANVEAQIRATTAFGAKYVDLIYPAEPSAERLHSGQELYSRNVTTEVNTVFQNLVGVLNQIDVAKLNSIVSAVAEGVRGKGERMGEATVAAQDLLRELNPRMDTVQQNWRALNAFNNTYSNAAADIIAVLKAATTTSKTVTGHESDIDALLLNTIGLSTTAIQLLGPSKDNLVTSVNTLLPTTDVLLKYNPEYTCLLQGAKWWLDNGGSASVGGNGKSLIVDAAILLGSDTYAYPDNLAVVAAKGGPGGRPGCGSLPDATKNWPVRQLVTNTGWGTGLDWRPNPGIGHPFYIDYLPQTRAVPEAPTVRGDGPPAPGPIVPPNSPPYGAAQYGPDGKPLWPSLATAPENPALVPESQRAEDEAPPG